MNAQILGENEWGVRAHFMLTGLATVLKLLVTTSLDVAVEVFLR